jgi:hypothetical protein
MIYPGYQLNPGDMFQVDPDRVMFALGAPKDADDRASSNRFRRRIAKAKARLAEEAEAAEETTEEVKEEKKEEETEEKTEAEVEAEEAKKKKEHKATLKSLLDEAKDIVSLKGADAPSAKKKQKIRAFAATVRKTLGSVNRSSTEDLDAEVASLISKLQIESGETAESKAATPEDSGVEVKVQENDKGEKDLAPASREMIAQALREIRENPIDPSKPYATPWRPRPFLPAFAFVPKYLEVNQNVCSAVYLRHPVARPGLAEVPAPFDEGTYQLAYNFYLRNGR